MLSDEIIQNDNLSAVDYQDYVEKLNSYIANSASQNDNENYSPPINCK